MARQHCFNICQRRQRQHIRDSELAETLEPPVTETDESSQSGISPSSSEGTKPSCSEVFICGKSWFVSSSSNRQHI